MAPCNLHGLPGGRTGFRPPNPVPMRWWAGVLNPAWEGAEKAPMRPRDRLTGAGEGRGRVSDLRGGLVKTKLES